MTMTAPAISLDDSLPVDVPKPEADDIRFWAVTTILGCLDKPALIYWAAGLSADAAIAVAKSLPQRIEEEGHDQVWKWIRDARFRKPKGQRSATELGTAVHDACEQYAITGVRPSVDAEVMPFLDRFDEWVTLWQPEYIAAELTVYSPTYGYAGTADGFFKIQGTPLIFDYKSTRKGNDDRGKPSHPYPEVALQLAAYRYAEMAAAWRPRRHEAFKRRYYLMGEDEREMAVEVPPVEGGVVVHITPDHCHAYPVNCGPNVHTAFLYVQEAARWTFEMSKSVIGDRLVHPAEVAA